MRCVLQKISLQGSRLLYGCVAAGMLSAFAMADAEPDPNCAAYRGLGPASATAADADQETAVETVAVNLQATEAAADEKSDKPAAPEEGWTSLFNGKDLTGWTPKIRGYKSGENFGNTFRVEDGYLTVRYDAYEKFGERFGHLFYKTPYSNYLMRVEYRFVGDQCPEGPGWATRNSGVMIHGQTPESMAVDQKFPVSIEVQLLGGTGNGKRPTANLCTPGTHVVMDDKLLKRHCTSSKSETYHGEQWVTVDIEVYGNKVIRHWIDNVEVLSYQQPQLDPGDAEAKLLIVDGKVQLSGGTISLQSESHPVQFRKVWIKELPAGE